MSCPMGVPKAYTALEGQRDWGQGQKNGGGAGAGAAAGAAPLSLHRRVNRFGR